MQGLYKQLLKNKFLILVLVSSVLSFLGLYIAETFFTIVPHISEIIRGFAMALLTSGVVGFVFEYLTRKEFSEVIQLTVHNEIQSLEYKIAGKTDENKKMFSFWRSFVGEGTTILIAQDESGIEPMVRVADISAAFHLYTMLIKLFSLPDEIANIEIDYVSKSDTDKHLCSFRRHIVIVGAPGGNPLATVALNEFHGISPDVKQIQNGYVFSIDISTPQHYLESPFLVSKGEDLPSILEIKKGEIINRYERKPPQHLDGIGRDSCLVEYGVTLCEQDRLQKVLLIAGHSRFSTLDGVNFVLANEDWANQVTKFNGKPTATILETSISMPHGRVVKVAKPPHLI